MCYVKRLFWDADDVVMQLHPRESEYVNAHPHVLHAGSPGFESARNDEPFIVFGDAGQACRTACLRRRLRQGKPAPCGLRAEAQSAKAGTRRRTKPENGRSDSPRRLPSTRSGCVNQLKRFVPRDGCRIELANSRCGIERV
jgi:hypothetical protein